MRFRRILLFAGSVLLAHALPVRACTMVMVGTEDVALAGNNEDYIMPFTSIWFVPASEGEYGRVCFGFEDPYEVALGGMNDQGLFIDGNSCYSTGWAPDSAKADFHGNVEGHVLAHCATVEEAVAFFEENNVGLLSRARFPIADKSGASVMIEWNGGKLRVLRKEGDYQVSTNFLLTDYPGGDYPCYRFRLAEKMLGGADRYTVDLVRSVLTAVRMEGSTPTLYSNIFDLRTGDIYIYNFHDFEHVVEMNLFEELEKGRSHHALPGLFPFTGHAHRYFVPSATVSLFERSLEGRGAEEILGEFSEIRSLCLEAFGVDFTEEIVNSLGYFLLGKQRVDEAIMVLRFNTEQYPESFNAFDSIGEAYKIHGDRELAIQNYRKSLELNPNNENGRKMLEELEADGE